MTDKTEAALEYMRRIKQAQKKAKKEGKITTRLIDSYILDFYTEYEKEIRRALEYVRKEKPND